MINTLLICAIAAEIIGLVLMLFRNHKTFAAAQLMANIGGVVSGVLLFLSVGLALVGLASSLKSFLTSIGLGLLGSLLSFAGFVLGDKLEQRVKAPKAEIRSGEKKETRRKKKESNISPWTLPAIVVLLAALSVKALSNVLSVALGWAITIPNEWFDFLTTILLIIYLIICVLEMTPVGLLVFTVIAAVGCAGVYFLVWTAGVMVSGFVLGAAISAFLSGVLITGFITGGTLLITSITVFTYTPVLIPMIVAVPVAVTAAGGVGMAAAAGAAAAQSAGGLTFIKKILNTLINIVLAVTVCIPLLSASTGINGIFRSKPGYVFGMQFLNRHNLITADSTLDKVPGLGSGELKKYYASMDVFEQDNRNALQITDDFNIDADNATIAILHGGVLHVYDAETMTVLSQEACPISNSKDTVILANTIETYVLGDEDLFIVNYEDPSNVRHYYRKDYPWRKEFLAMNDDEQMDYVYHLMMDTENVYRAPLEDAAIIKLSAQKGQLIHYNFEEKYALFARQNGDSSAAFLLQTSPEERNEFGSMAYYKDYERVPYYWDDYAKYVSVKIDASTISGVFINGDTWKPAEMYQGRRILSSNTIHNWNDEYCIMDMTPDRLYVFNYPANQWVNMDTEPEITENSTGLLQAGNTLYAFYYQDGGLLRKFTYLKDMKEMEEWPFKKKYVESHYHGLRYIYRQLNENFGGN